LLQVIHAWGYSYLATGHYARIEVDADGTAALLRGLDSRKDQSYFLHRLKIDSLASIIFPLGRLTKKPGERKKCSPGTRSLYAIRESQETLFITGNYADFIHSLGEENHNAPGPLSIARVKCLETSWVRALYCGPTPGLGVSAPAPYYVLEILPELNQVVVGYKEELQSTAIEVEDINWLIPAPTGPLWAEVRIRYRHPGVGCLISPFNATHARVSLNHPQTAVTPGQAAVFTRANGFWGRLDRPGNFPMTGCQYLSAQDRRLGFITFGCKVNQYESAFMAETAANMGFICLPLDCGISGD